MPKILLTGATGFIGSSLINYLGSELPEALHDIVVLSSNKYPGLPTILYQPLSYVIPPVHDVADVIHVGAFTPKSSNDANDIERCTSNILFTSNLLARLPETVRQFVFISTVDVYKSSNQVTDENSLVNPVSLYAWSKLYCEKMVNEWCNQQNVSCKILRLGHIYGTGEDAYKKLIPETIKKILLDEPPVVFTNGYEKRSFLHVNDCVRCIWNAVKVENEESLVNIVSGSSKTVLEIINMLIEISGKTLKPKVLNKEIVTRDYVFNNARMMKIYGIEKKSLFNGLKEEYEYFLSKHS